jgi:hypothetical protein
MGVPVTADLWESLRKRPPKLLIVAFVVKAMMSLYLRVAWVRQKQLGYKVENSFKNKERIK